MPQLDPAGFAPQIFWLVVTFVILFLVMQFVAAPRMGRVIDARRQQLDGDLGRAAALKVEAEGVLAAYEKALADARVEAQTTLRQTAEKMAAEAAEQQRRLAAALAEQVAAAEHRIAAGKEAALADIRGVAADIGQAVVEKLTGAPPSADRMVAAVNGALTGRAG